MATRSNNRREELAELVKRTLAINEGSKHEIEYLTLPPCLHISVPFKQPSVELADRIEAFRKLGNLNFKSGKYNEAIKFYTRAIMIPGINPDASLYNNRGFCHLKLKNYEDVIKDCGHAKLIFDTTIKTLIQKKTPCLNSFFTSTLSGATKATVRLMEAYKGLDKPLDLYLTVEYLKTYRDLKLDNGITAMFSDEELDQLYIDNLGFLKVTFEKYSLQQMESFIQESLTCLSENMSPPRKILSRSIPMILHIITRAADYKSYAARYFVKHNGLSIVTDKRIYSAYQFTDVTSSIHLSDCILYLVTRCAADEVAPFAHLLRPPPPESDTISKDFYIYNANTLLKQKSFDSMIAKKRCKLVAFAASRFVDNTVSITPLSSYTVVSLSTLLKRMGNQFDIHPSKWFTHYLNKRQILLN